MGVINIQDVADKPEHILVCLSETPANVEIIRKAAKMASAFGGNFTVLYVQTPDWDKKNQKDKDIIHENIRLAEQLGADITIVYGEDISTQIAEFARVSGVTKILIGRTVISGWRYWKKSLITERLLEAVPDLDIYIIPDTTKRHKHKDSNKSFLNSFKLYPKDILITLLILVVTTTVGIAFLSLGFTEPNIIMVYILGVLLTSLFTRGYTCSVLGSCLSVTLFNFFITEPRLTFHAYGSGYPVTFVIMLSSSIITGTLAAKLKAHAKMSAQSAFRMKVLLNTNQMLQKAQDDNEIFNITASQLVKLLDRSIVIYTEKDGRLTRGYMFCETEGIGNNALFSIQEHTVAEWFLQYKKSSIDVVYNANGLYMPIGIGDKLFGVVGIAVEGKPLDYFEKSVLHSILGECALALDSSHNAKEKELAAILAKNEQLRANLLRTISHDLRTPLTSISGNASNLLTNYEALDEEIRKQIFTDIFDDAQWLIGLVENLLSVTRIEEGRMNFNMSVQLMDEVVEEAMKHISRKSCEHNISVEFKEEFILARIDAKLIIQVIINLVDNAIKYTQKDSDIKLVIEKKEKFVSVSVADNGEGIADSIKPRVFDMFYTGDNKVADSRRSLGMGLSLCKAIINAHGGEITLQDNVPKGCVFTFTVPSGEVIINE